MAKITCRYIHNFFNPKKDNTNAEEIIFVLCWIFLLYVVSILLQKETTEPWLSNFLLKNMVDAFASVIPSINKYCAYFKTNLIHSKLIIFFGIMGGLIVAILEIRNFKFIMLKVYEPRPKRSKQSELFLIAITLIFNLGSLTGYYPARTLWRYGLQPEHSLFKQGLLAFLCSIIFVATLILVAHYIARNKYERKMFL